MKQIFQKLFIVIIVLFFTTSCQHKGIQTLDLSAAKKLLSVTNDYQLVDVRTASEYESGHLKGAINLDVNENNFENNISKLNKDKPVVVYCFSGSRSASAANILSENGFKNVYNIPGIMSWRNDGTELETKVNSAQSSGMSIADFKQALQAKEFVLVDFNAVWCKPCKIIAPFLEKSAEARKEKMVLVPVDADANATLVQHFSVDALPTLILFQNGKQIWRNTGLLDEEELNKELNRLIQ